MIINPFGAYSWDFCLPSTVCYVREVLGEALGTFWAGLGEGLRDMFGRCLGHFGEVFRWASLKGKFTGDSTGGKWEGGGVNFCSFSLRIGSRIFLGQWKRTALARGGGGPASQYCPLYKNHIKTVTSSQDSGHVLEEKQMIKNK